MVKKDKLKKTSVSRCIILVSVGSYVALTVEINKAKYNIK